MKTEGEPVVSVAVSGLPRSRSRPNLKDVVADHLRRLILSGQLPSESKIDQDALAAELGVSKLPVREALITLETESLVRNLPRRGAFVAPLTPEDVRDHYRVYGLVSAVATERAATVLRPDDVAELEQILRQMEQSSDAAALERLNYDFHRRINVAGGSRRLRSVILQLSQSIPGRFYEFTINWAEAARLDHRRILDSLRAGDGPAAASAMADHLRASGDQAVHLLAAQGFWRD